VARTGCLWADARERRRAQGVHNPGAHTAATGYAGRKYRCAQLSTLLKRLTELERDLRDLEGRAVSKDELDRLATETKRLTVRDNVRSLARLRRHRDEQDSAYIDQLDLKTSLLDLEGDVAQLIKHANTHIRI
jgi:hypothetical protein